MVGPVTRALQMIEGSDAQKSQLVAVRFSNEKRYTTQEIFDVLAKQYRSPRMSNTVWWDHANAIMDKMEHFGHMYQENGFYLFDHDGIGE